MIKEKCTGCPECGVIDERWEALYLSCKELLRPHNKLSQVNKDKLIELLALLED